MNKVITGMMGFDPSDIDWGKMDVVAEIKTGGTDSDGFTDDEVFGLAIDQYNQKCLYLNTVDSHLGLDGSVTLVFGEGGKDIPTLLRRLADELEGMAPQDISLNLPRSKHGNQATTQDEKIYYFKLLLSGKFIAVKHGETGYNTTTVYDQAHADTLNSRQGINTGECEAAEYCSMFNKWDKFEDLKHRFEKVVVQSD